MSLTQCEAPSDAVKEALEVVEAHLNNVGLPSYERLAQDNIALARNLKGKAATTGATYEHLCQQLATARADQAESMERLEKMRAYVVEIQHFVNAVTHWVEGPHDRHGALLNIKGALAIPTACSPGAPSDKDVEIARLRRHIADIGEAMRTKATNNPGGVKASTLELLGEELLSVLP